MISESITHFVPKVKDCLMATFFAAKIHDYNQRLITKFNIFFDNFT